MALSRTRKTILFIKYLAEYASFFCILPSYDFIKYKLRNETFKYFRCMFVATIVFANVIEFHLRAKSVYYYIHPALVHMNVVIEMTSLLLFIVSSFQTIVNRKQWEQLLGSFKTLDSVLMNHNTRHEEKAYFWKNANFIFLLSHCLRILFTVLRNMGKEKQLLIIQLKYFWSTVFHDYIEMIFLHIICNLFVYIRVKYENINSILINTNHLITNWDDVERVTKYYLIMDKAVAIMNDFFGWTILLIFIRNIQIVIYGLSSPLAPPYFLEGSEIRFPAGFQLLNVASALYVMFQIIVIVFCVDLASREPHKLLKFCISLQDKIPVGSREYERLEVFKSRIREMLPKFTAANFFRITRSTILSIISVITTYFIVVVQFYLTSKK